MEHRVTSTSAYLNFLKCYWLPSFPPSPEQLQLRVSWHMQALPNTGLCRSQNSQDQFPDAQYNFSVMVRDRVVGTDCSLCIVEEIRHPHVGCQVAPFHCVKCGGNDFGDKPLWTDHAIWMLQFGNGTNGNLGKFFDFETENVLNG
jgi:hypothetical protein